MEDEFFNPDFFGEMGAKLQNYSQKQQKKRRKSSSRTDDLILNKQDILNDLEFVDSTAPFPMPKVQKVAPFDLPSVATPFSKVLNRVNKDTLVVFTNRIPNSQGYFIIPSDI